LKPLRKLAPHETAVLVVDVQNDFVDDKGRVGREGADMRPLQAATREINRLIGAARDAGAHVFYISVEHGGDVDLAPYQARYARRGMTPDDTICHAGTWGAELYASLTPPSNTERRFVKHGYDAFHVTALQTELERLGIRAVVVVGVVTELCVRATATSAFERGFFPIVPRECTASTEPDRAREALESIERWYGEVVSLGEVLESWNAASVGSRESG
jgi:ureidoacrylate peracid hydrolase